MGWGDLCRWTNIPFLVVGVLTTTLQDPLYSSLRWCGPTLIMVGIGSMMFHGQLTRLGQAVDELAILYWEITLLFTVFEKQLRARPFLSRYIWALFLAENVLYFQMDRNPKLGWFLYHPLHLVVDIVVVSGLYVQCGKHASAWRFIRLGLILILIAFSAWLLDMFHCDAVRGWHLHAFGWHFFALGAITCLHIALAMQICIQNKRDTCRIFGLTLPLRDEASISREGHRT